MSLLRDRMSRDMERAGLAPLTRKEYIAAIRHMTSSLAFPWRTWALRTSAVEDDEWTGAGWGRVGARVHVAALLFLYRKTLGRPELVSFLAFPRRPRRLPVVLSPGGGRPRIGGPARAQIPGLLRPHLRHRAPGFRGGAPEGRRPRPVPGVIKVVGKGGRERQVKLGDRLYDLLRAYWAEVRAKDRHEQGQSRDSWLFVSGVRATTSGWRAPGKRWPWPPGQRGSASWSRPIRCGTASPRPSWRPARTCGPSRPSWGMAASPRPRSTSGFPRA